jgi:hypothetical protein
LILLFAAISACARPTGDFGRAESSILHDEIMPKIGQFRVKRNGEPLSTLNLTDEENEMHDRVWRFLIAAHSRDWFYDIVVEWQRVRLAPLQDKKFSIDRYYSFLRSERYSSSKVRYYKVANDIDADLGTVPSVFNAICAVSEIDRRRLIAVSSLKSAGQVEKISVANRKAENQIYIDWFVRAIRYRYQSYSLALERLLIETPHEGARDIDARLSRFAIEVERAERHDFCGSSLVYNQTNNPNMIASRYSTNQSIFNSSGSGLSGSSSDFSEDFEPIILK